MSSLKILSRGGIVEEEEHEDDEQIIDVQQQQIQKLNLNRQCAEQQLMNPSKCLSLRNQKSIRKEALFKGKSLSKQSFEDKGGNFITQEDLPKRNFHSLRHLLSSIKRRCNTESFDRNQLPQFQNQQSNQRRHISICSLQLKPIINSVKLPQMSTKTNMKNVLDHTVPSPKKNQSSNYYSQLFGRTNSHLHSGFMSPQVNSINSNQQIQNAMLNSLQVPNQLFSSQQQSAGSTLSTNMAVSVSQSHSNPGNLEGSKHSNTSNNTNSNTNTNNNNMNSSNTNNYKLTDILSTRYSSGTLKLLRNGQTSTSSNPRQLSSDARQIEIGGSIHSNSNQDFVHSPAHSQKNQQQVIQGGLQNSQVQSGIPQNQSNQNYNSGNSTSQKQQLMNKVKIQLTSQQQQKQQHQLNNMHHSQNVHNIHGGSSSGLTSHNSNQQNTQSSTISPRTFSNLVQDKLIRSKIQGNQQQQQQSASATGSVKDSTKNSLTSTKRPKSLKQIENEHYPPNQNHQQVHEQNMNILASMTLNNRNGSEKNLMRSQQLAGQIVQQSVTAQQQQNSQQYQQHIQQIQQSKMMLAQQQNNSHNHQGASDQFNNIILASAKATNTAGPSSIVNNRYEINWAKHQTSHSVEKFRGQSESLDMHQLNKQPDSLAQQVQKVIMNKQQLPKKSSTIIPETSKARNKKHLESSQSNNHRASLAKKQQNSTLQSNLSHSQQTTALHINSLNNQSANLNTMQTSSISNNNYMLSNYSSIQNTGPQTAPSMANNLSNYNTKQTLSAITQRIQQNLNILGDPLASQQKAPLSQNIIDLQNFPANIHQHHSSNIAEFINRVDVDQLQFDIGISNQDKRDHSGKRGYSQNQQQMIPLNSSKVAHKHTGSITEINKNSQQNTLQNEEIPNQPQINQQQAIQVLINNSHQIVNSRNGQQNIEQFNSNSNTPQGKIINSGGYNKQQTHAHHKDGAKHQIYFMKEKERGTKKNDYGNSKSKRKGEQSTPHSNSQGYPQILMSNSAVNQSTQGQLAMSALQKSSGSISAGAVNQNLLNSNIIKYLNKQSTRNDDEKIVEQLTGINSIQNSQYQMASGQIYQRRDDHSKERELQAQPQNENIQSGNHHEKRNSLPEGSQVFKKTFASTEGSYLGDLKQQPGDIIPFMSPKTLSNFNSGSGNPYQKHGDNMSSIQEVNSNQSTQNKNSTLHSSINKPQIVKHVNPNSNTFASPISTYTQQQNQQFANSFQNKTINDDSVTNSQIIQEKGKYFQTLFNNLFVKDGKKKLTEKLTNQTSENTQLNGSTSHVKNLTEQIHNSSSHVNEYKQKQLLQSEYASSDQRLEELPQNVISYNIKNQLKQQNTDPPIIRTYAASAETTPPMLSQHIINNVLKNQSPSQSASITQKNSVTVSPFNQLKSQVLRSGDELIEKLRETIDKDVEVDEVHTPKQDGEFSSLNSSIIKIKTRQSIYVQSDNQLKEQSSHPNLASQSQNNMSFSQQPKIEIFNNFSSEFKILQSHAEKILNKYKNNSNQLTQINKEQNIRISELNQILQQKDTQFDALQIQYSELQKQNEKQKEDLEEKDNFIQFLKSQIQDLVQNPQIHQNVNQQSQYNYLAPATTNNKINIINNYQSSPSGSRSINSINSYSPQQPNKKYNNHSGHTKPNNFNQYDNQYYGDEELQKIPSIQQQIRHSLPVFTKGFYEYSQGTPVKDDEEQEEQSADFTGNKDQNPLDTSYDSFKKYQINSQNKRQYIKNPLYTSKNNQNSHQKNSQTCKLGKQNNQIGDSSNKEDENDPLNDSMKMLKEISKKSQDKSDYSSKTLSSRKQSNSQDQNWIKPFHSTSENSKHNEQTAFITPHNEVNTNTFYIGNQGSFSNLQQLEKDPQFEVEEENCVEKIKKDNRYSEALTSATPSNSQNQTLSHQINQRQQYRLFSTDQDDHSNRNSANQINVNESFSNGGACFGGSNNDPETNSQNVDNSFGECCFGQQSNNEQIFSQQDTNSNRNNIQMSEQNAFGIKRNSQDISISSKSSLQIKNISGSNSPNLNNSFSKKSTPIQIVENCTSSSFQQQNPLNNSFNLNSQRREEEEEVVPIQFANSSFSLITANQEAQQANPFGQSNTERRGSIMNQDQVNISFEGFGSAPNEQSNQQQQNDSFSQNNQQINEKQHNQAEEQENEEQQGISFTNQSFG